MEDNVHERMIAGLQVIRDALQADGADLQVVGMQGSTAKVRLVMGPETCQECIMPKDFLEEIMLSGLQETMPQVERVELEDPRAS